MSNEIQVTPDSRSLSAEEKPKTIAEIKTHIGVIQSVVKDVMKRDVHFGQIPGTQTPTLYKAGAEVIASTFRLAPEYTVEDLSSYDENRYRVTCGLISSSGILVGSGLGEASSNEQKYRWRVSICDEEFDYFPEDRRRIKFVRKKGGGHYEQKQVRTEPADIANTILKMASKRAMVAAILTATAASDCFGQDLEGLPQEVLDEITGAYSDGERPNYQVPSETKKASKTPIKQPKAKVQSEKPVLSDEPITSAQLTLLNKKLESLNVSQESFIKAFRLDSIKELPQNEINNAFDWISGESEI